MIETFHEHPLLDRILVGNKGTIISTRTWKQLKTHVNRTGYEEMCMNVGSRTNKSRHTVNFKIHRLVAETYLDGSRTKETVNHIDANKLNNTVDNLEWMTLSENREHARKKGLLRGWTLSQEHLNLLKTKRKEWYETVGKYIRKRDSFGKYL